MSIKQNGGVFGRNPTFNDVTVEGDLIINGEVFTGLDFQGSWNASTNTPALASSVGTNGEFYIVSIAGSTDLNGITNWGIGDWALFNGTVWQRVEGGADGNFNDLTVAGTSTLTGNVGIGTVPDSKMHLNDGALHIQQTDGSDTWFGLGTNNDNYITTGASGITVFRAVGTERMRIDPSGHAIIPAGVTLGTAAGVYSAANTLDDYETGTWTATFTGSVSGTEVYTGAKYVKIGKKLFIALHANNIGTGLSGNITVTGLPFNIDYDGALSLFVNYAETTDQFAAVILATTINFYKTNGTLQDKVKMTNAHINTYTDFSLSGSCSVT